MGIRFRFRDPAHFDATTREAEPGRATVAPAQAREPERAGSNDRPRRAATGRRPCGGAEAGRVMAPGKSG